MTKKSKQVYSEWRARIMRAEEKIEHLNEKIAEITTERDSALEEIRKLRKQLGQEENVTAGLSSQVEELEDEIGDNPN